MEVDAVLVKEAEKGGFGPRRLRRKILNMLDFIRINPMRKGAKIVLDIAG